MVYYSPHFDKLWISVTVFCCKKKVSSMRNNKDKDTIQFESTPSLDVGIRGSVEFTTMQVMGRYFTKFTVPDINSPLLKWV